MSEIYLEKPGKCEKLFLKIFCSLKEYCFRFSCFQAIGIGFAEVELGLKPANVLPSFDGGSKRKVILLYSSSENV